MRFRGLLLPFGACLSLLGILSGAPACEAAKAAAKAPVKTAAAAKTAAPAPAPDAMFRRDLPDPPGPGTLPDDYVMLRIDDKAINAREFVDLYFSAWAADRPKQDSLGRVDFMKTLIHRDLLAREAKRIDKPLGFEDRLTLREHTARVYSNTLYQRVVLDRVKVDTADVRKAYDLFKTEVHLRQILFTARETAEKIRRDLLAGRIGWSAAVRRYSMSEKENDGDIGWQSASQMGLQFAVHTHRLRPGEYTPLIRTRDGWLLVHCLERRDVRPPAFEALHKLIRGQLESAQANVFADALQDSLVAQIGLTVDTTNVRWAASHFGNTQNYENGTLNIDASVPEFTMADTGRVLVRFRGGQLSLGVFMDQYQHIPPVLRPTVNTFSSLAQQAIATALEPYNVQLAIERGIDKDPIAVRQVEKKREELLVEHLYEDSVMSAVHVGPDEMRRYYETHKHQFVASPYIRYAAITRPTRAGIDSVAARIRAGESGEAILQADSLAGRVSGSMKERWMNEEGQPYHRLLFEELRPGKFSVEGPDDHGDYLVLQVITRNEAKQYTYEEAIPWLEQTLQNTAAEARLDQFIARLARSSRISWRPDLVMRTDFRMREGS